MQKLEIGRTMPMAGGARSVRAAWAALVVYGRLVRPGLTSTVLFSMAIAALTAPEPPSVAQLAHALLGTGLVIAGATAMNQWMERRQDAAMRRTASRPLPAGLVTPQQAALLAAFLSLAGLGYLAAVGPPLVAILAALSWIIYVWVYTPMKRVSLWHIPAGAVSGAMPVLLGGAAAGAVGDPITLALFAVVFFWQFPHTAAIGWMYREQYARCEMQVAAVVDPSRLAGQLALGGAAGMLLASLVPVLRLGGGVAVPADCLTLGLAASGTGGEVPPQARQHDARALFRASMVHLPLLLLAWLLV